MVTSPDEKRSSIFFSSLFFIKSAYQKDITFRVVSIPVYSVLPLDLPETSSTPLHPVLKWRNPKRYPSPFLPPKILEVTIFTNKVNTVLWLYRHYTVECRWLVVSFPRGIQQSNGDCRGRSCCSVATGQLAMKLKNPRQMSGELKGQLPVKVLR